MKGATPKRKRRSGSSSRPSRQKSKPKASAKRKPGKHKERVEREVSAGGVVFKRTPRGIRFAVMLDSYEKWTFPKGRQEEGEELEEAAARETLEELGLEEIRLLEYLGKIDIWFRDRFEKKGALVHKDIHYFLFETPSDAKLHTDPSQHSYKGKWVSLKKLPESSSYADMAPIISRAQRYVREQALD